MRRCSVFVVVLTCFAVNGGESFAAETSAPNLVRETLGLAKVSVDSTFAGYNPAVLTDGRWIATGRETTQEFGSPDRLGNRGNTWVSANTPGEHWIRLDWPRPVRLDEVEIAWSLAEFRPRAFRIERLCDGRWEPLAALAAPVAAAATTVSASTTANVPTTAWEPTDRRSVVVLAPVEVASLRIVQPAGAASARGVFGAQEIRVFYRDGTLRASSGVRAISAAELARPREPELVRNIASIGRRWPAAAAPTVWLPDGGTQPAPALADEVVNVAAGVPPTALAVGVQWPIAHVVDGASVVLTAKVPADGTIALETLESDAWRPVTAGLTIRRRADAQAIDFAIEPVAAHGLRVRLSTPIAAAIAEFDAYRYMPPRKDVWPARLVKRPGLAEEVLAAAEEPSFERLAACSLPMSSVRFALGLKDTLRETGVAWDGTLVGRETIRLRIGTERFRMAEGRETLRRSLIDGWRPGVVVETRLGPLEVRQTSLAVPVDNAPGESAVVLRVAVRNLSDRAVECPVQAELEGDRPGAAAVIGGSLRRGDDVVLIAAGTSRQGDSEATLCIDLRLPPGGEAAAEFVHPQAACRPATLPAYRALRQESALPAFRRYWDERLAGGVLWDVPEPRVVRMQKAVLSQIFVNGDGDIQYYGTEPSCYGDSLFGLEESYLMLALSQCGFSRDAQRYMDATYLTEPFLKKTEKYGHGEDRHQQYRNGLEPHYAVSAYRLSRDRAWIAKHWPLLRRCAEWTIAERRKTMQLEGGRKPLHWGLLPAWAYGGDILEVTCYALYGNLACWRGLVDTAWLAEELGDRDAARRYADEARAYRADIDRAVAGTDRPHAKPPFLPLRLYADKPDEQMDYYQLFAGAMLELDYFDVSDAPLRRITTFMEDDNRMFCRLPRFRRDAGAGGLDALYGKGYASTLLHQGKVREHLLAFYAFLAFNMDHETFVSRETNVLYTSDLHARSVYGVIEASDPVPSSSAVALHMLRNMLVTEGRLGPDGRSSGLTYLAGAPRAWLADGRRIAFTGAPTHFGPTSLEVRSFAASDRIEATLAPPRRNPPPSLTLRLPHPEGKKLREVRIDGAAWTHFNAEADTIALPVIGDPVAASARPRTIVATYGP